MKRFVLAYSGGLDTSVILKWLQVTHDADVVTVTADFGQRIELEGVKEKALATGASRAFVEDLRDEFVRDYVWPTFKAGALYQDQYPLATAIGRPLIARRLVEVARDLNADAIVHGCTGKGNDQVRFEVSIAALAPDLERIAPLRTWDLKTREAEIAWAHQHGVAVRATKDSPYSIDENLWGISVEAGPLEDPWVEPPHDCWQWTADPAADSAKPEYATIAFEHGLPVAIDGQAMHGVELIGVLNVLAGAHGVGRIDMVEDRLVGIKSREIYEAPAAVTLHAARTSLAQLTLDRQTRRVLATLGHEFSQLVYDGLWFTPIRKAISAFVDEAVAPMTGEVQVKLHAGTAMPVARRSSNSLYDEALATYGDGDAFDHDAAQGFIQLFGQSARVTNAAMREVTSSSAIPTVTTVDA